MKGTKTKAVVRIGAIEQRILLIRGERVIIDADLANFYGVRTKRLNEQVKRNKDRFPGDFMFQLNAGEKRELVAACDHLSGLRFAKSRPFAFTEHGAIMAASVLNSPRAVAMSVFVVRAFVKLRRAIAEHKDLMAKLGQLERRLGRHDQQIVALVKAIKQLAAPEAAPKRRQIGYRAKA